MTDREFLMDLHKLHIVTKKFKHIIEYEPGSWKMFEPSKFIYAYFSFNTFYNFDWQTTVETKTLSTFPKNIINGKEQDPTEGFKYKAMLDFIFKYADDNDKSNFISFIKKGNTIDSLKVCIDGIMPDSRIKESEITDFKREFKNLIEEQSISVSKLKKYIIRFISLVRNNIFHGTKTTIEMSDKGQRQRLEIYSNILISTNQLLFNVLERELQITFDRTYKIQIR